ncbi:CopD family protein [Streptomyces sp. NPDC002935]|uniref:CopD family protein n=1 Tax=Streptomyces sp. NPDC002935 TaxID=3154545 RepID=UPI0033B0FF3C
MRPTAEAAHASAAARRQATRRAVAVLALVTVAALIPLLGPRTALTDTGEAAAPGTGGIALLRTVLFAALCVPAGELFAARLARRVPGAPPVDPPRGWATYAAAAGFIVALGLASVVATGNLLPRHLSDMDVGGLYQSRDGRLALLEVNAFAAAWICARSRRPAAQVWPLAAVVLAEALRAHPATEPGAPVGSALTLVHVTCAALWAGGLLYVLRLLRGWRAAEGEPTRAWTAVTTGPGTAVTTGPGTAMTTGPGATDPTGPGTAMTTGPEPGEPTGPGTADPTGPGAAGGSAAGAALLGLYARVAAVLFAAITATGVWSALRRMPPGTMVDQLTSTAYGRTLLAKVLLVAAVAVLALWARLRLRRARDPLSACSPARAEIVALGVVVAMSGLLTALPLPIRW